MNYLPRSLRVIAFVSVAIATPLWAAPDKAPPPADAQAPVKSVDADNTRINARDKSADTVKPTDQSNAKPDIQLAAAVRRAIEDDKSLSTSAHNVKLVANGGVVTLRGPVANDSEKQKIEQLVAAVKGVTRVDNNLDVQVAKNNKE